MIGPKAPRIAGSRLFETPRGMLCGTTAVCAITGRSPDDVVSVGLIPSPQAEVAFLDQLKTLEALGCRLLDRDGKPIQAADLQRPGGWKKGELDSAATIGSFVSNLAAKPPPDVVIVHATRVNPDTDKLQSHSFVIDGSWFFDCNTPKGRPIPLAEVRHQVLDREPVLADMRVVELYIVRCPETLA
jgi:hypothetical protein